MIKVEEIGEGEEWKDIQMSPRGLISGFESSDHSVSKSFVDIFDSAVDLGGHYDCIKLENSTLDGGNMILDGGGSGVDLGDHYNHFKLENSVVALGKTTLGVGDNGVDLGGLYNHVKLENSTFDAVEKVTLDGGGTGVDLGDRFNHFKLENSTFDTAEKATMDGGGNGLCSIGKSIAERRAAKCGFDAAKISTPRFRTSSPLTSPGACSPFLSIRTGISPHMLLDSPILLPNSQLSPTTGSLTVPSFDRDNQRLISASYIDADSSCDVGTSSMLKPVIDKTSVSSLSDMESQTLVPLANCQPINFESPMRFSEEVGMISYGARLPPDRKCSEDLTTNSSLSSIQPCGSNVFACVQMPDKNNLTLGEDSGNISYLDGKLKKSYQTTGTVITADDGYNWRKYGQKQVKGSEFPRSYYKCTYPNCPMKKKVERSHNGNITEIIYKGDHDHPMPQPCRKSPYGSSPIDEIPDIGDGTSTCAKAEGGPVWRDVQTDVKYGPDWRIDGLEASVVTEVSDPLSTIQGRPMGMLDSVGTPEFSSTLVSQEDEEEDAATQGTYVVGDDHENDQDSKRRKKDGCYSETRAVREPRVVVQIESEVDILDDGYRWRKYGQKVVKGNPNPRSYYKCTSAGCNVRKQVERAAQNLKFVITTYEGKHNHEVPAARNSHSGSGNGSLPPAVPNAQSTMTLPRNPHAPKPDPHTQDFSPQFDARVRCDNDFLRPNFLGAGTPPIYQMKFPALPNTTPYGPFGLTSHRPAYTNGNMPAIPDLTIPLPLGFSRSFSNYPNPEGPFSSVQSLYARQQLSNSDINLIRPKQEQRDESFYDTEMHSVDYSNNSSSVSNNINRTFPS